MCGTSSISVEPRSVEPLQSPSERFGDILDGLDPDERFGFPLPASARPRRPFSRTRTERRSVPQRIATTSASGLFDLADPRLTDRSGTFLTFE
jgi:hypothetical protein